MPTILFVGDSITVGLVGSPMKFGFRGPFAKLASFRVGSVITGYEAVGPFVDPTGLKHGGIGGASMNTYLGGAGQFAVLSADAKAKGVQTWLERFKPNFVHIMLGTNDLISKRPIKAIADDYQTLLNAAHAIAPATKILVGSIPEVGPLHTVEYNALLRERVAAGTLGPGTSFVDTSQKINEVFHKEGSAAIAVDGTHPNQRGYDLMGVFLAQTIAGAKPVSPVASGGSASSSITPANVFWAGAAAYAGYKLFKWWSP